MKEKYADFIKFLITQAKQRGKTKEMIIEFNRVSMINAVRAYFEYKSENTVHDTLEYFFKERYLDVTLYGFKLSDKAKKEFW